MKPITGPLMVTNAIIMQERTFRKEILLSQKYISILRQSINKEVRKQVFFKMNSSLGSHIILGRTKGCDQQKNNRDFGLFSIAIATELAFKGDPGTVSGVSTDRRCFPMYIALRYLYGPVKMD